MKSTFTAPIAICAALGMLLVGCSKEEGVDTSELEKAFSETQPAAETPAEPSQQEQVQDTVNKALTALKNEQYEEGSAALTALRSNPTLNGNQLTAV